MNISKTHANTNKPVQFKAKVSPQGQITLPKEVRNKINIKKGDSYVYISLISSNKISLKPAPKLSQFYGALPVGKGGTSAVDIVANIRKAEIDKFSR